MNAAVMIGKGIGNKRHCFSRIAISAVLLMVCTGIAGGQQREVATNDPIAALCVGHNGPRAVKLEVRTEQIPDKPVKVGDFLPVTLKADRDCYLTVMRVSGGGDVEVLFPNRQQPDNLLTGDREYSLFGEGAGIRMTGGEGGAPDRILFLATGNRIALDLPDGSDKQGTLNVTRGEPTVLEALKKRLACMADDPAFCRHVLTLKSETRLTPKLRLMGKPKEKRTPADTSLPPEGTVGTQGGRDTSRLPEGTTGTQGVQEGVGKPGKQ